MSEPATAYEKSIKIAAERMKQSGQAGPPKLTEIGWLEAERAKHKKAFRVAFDELNKLWPPENTLEYWNLAAKDLALVFNENQTNELCKSLLLALIDYLEKIGKERAKLYATDKPSDGADAGMDGR